MNTVLELHLHADTQAKRSDFRLDRGETAMAALLMGRALEAELTAFFRADEESDPPKSDLRISADSMAARLREILDSVSKDVQPGK